MMTYLEGGPTEAEADWRRVAGTLRAQPKPQLFMPCATTCWSSDTWAGGLGAETDGRCVSGKLIKLAGFQHQADRCSPRTPFFGI